MGLPLERIEGKYEILAKLREGGMGAIYKVRHRLLDEVRIVKVLRPQFEGDRDLEVRFAREARAAIRLRHPNVVQIFDFSVDDDGVGFIVMEYIRGADFQLLIDRGARPSVSLGLEMARQSLRAIGYLHKQGFLHRDVSPDNLMLTLDVDERPLVKVIDLGIAKQQDAEHGLTQSGMFLGKFRYSSPEHFGAEGAHGVREASDLYSLGIVLHELLTGEYPIRGQGNSQLIAGHLFHPPRPFEETDPEGRIPVPVRALIERSLVKQLGDRWQSAEEMVDAIADLQRSLPLDRSAVEEARGLVLSREDRDGSPSRGSTQQRLDEGFGLGTTPIPKATTERSAFDIHLEAGCRHAEEGRLTDAIGELERALELQPENRAVRLLLTEVRGRSAAGEASPPPMSVRTTPPTPPRPDPERVDEHLAFVRIAVEEGNFDAAESALSEAREAAAGDDALESRIGRSETEVELERTRHEGLTAAEGAVRQEIEASRLLSADRTLFQAEEEWGPHERLERLRDELDEAHRHDAEKLALEQYETGLALRGAHKTTEALHAVQRALALLPRDSRRREELAAVEENLLLEEDQRVLLESTRSRLEALLDRHEVDTARGVFDSVSRVLPGRSELAEFERRIEEAVERELADLLHLAEVATREDRLGLAVRYLTKAADLRPADQGVQERLHAASARRKAARSRDEDTQRRRAELEAIAALIEADLLEQAERRLVDEMQRSGDDERSAELTRRLAEHRRSAAVRVDDLVRRGRLSRERGDLDRARSLVRQALRIDSGHAGARALLDDLSVRP